MFLKKYHLPLLIVSVVLAIQSYSFVATNPQPQQEQFTTHIVKAYQAHQRYRKKATMAKVALFFHLLQIFLVRKIAAASISRLSNLLLFSPLFFICIFSLHFHSLFWLQTQTPKLDASFRITQYAVTFIIVMAGMLILASPFKVSWHYFQLIGAIMYLLPLITLVYYSIKRYYYAYLRQNDKNFWVIMKKCIADVWLDWLLFLVGTAIICMLPKHHIAYILIISLLPQMYAIRKSQLLLKNQPFWAHLCSAIELIIGVIATYLGITVSINAATITVIVANIWGLLKNAAIILQPSIKEVIQKYKTGKMNK